MKVKSASIESWRMEMWSNILQVAFINLIWSWSARVAVAVAERSGTPPTVEQAKRTALEVPESTVPNWSPMFRKEFGCSSVEVENPVPSSVAQKSWPHQQCHLSQEVVTPQTLKVHGIVTHGCQVLGKARFVRVSFKCQSRPCPRKSYRSLKWQVLK